MRALRRTSPPGLEIPSPLRSVPQVAAIGAVPLIFGAMGVIRPLAGLATASAFAAGGLLRGFAAKRERASLRRLADDELRLGKTHYVHSALIEWRSAELTSPRHRSLLARSLTRTVRDLSPKTLPGASPLNRVAVRPHADLLVELSKRLGGNRRVTPRGVLLVDELLTSPDSPLYAPERAPRLRPTLLACLDALDGVAGDVGYEGHHHHVAVAS